MTWSPLDINLANKLDLVSYYLGQVRRKHQHPTLTRARAYFHFTSPLIVTRTQSRAMEGFQGPGVDRAAVEERLWQLP